MGESDPTKFRPSAGDAISRMQRDRHVDVMAKSALSAVQEASRKKEQERREALRQELSAEIDRARTQLARLEERRAAGEPAPHLQQSIDKARSRLQQMEKALGDAEKEVPVESRS